MLKITAENLPFDYKTDADRSNGIYADFKPDGSIASVGYYEDGKLQTGVTFGDDIVLDRKMYFEADPDVVYEYDTGPLGIELYTKEAFEALSEEQQDEAEATQQLADWLKWTAFRKIENMANRVTECSFCGKKNNEVRKLIAGPSVYICDECITLCHDILVAESARG